MPQKLIDQTTIQPDGKPGDDAFTAFATCNDNFQDAEARLGVLETGGGEIGGRLDDEIVARTAADAALGARIDAEHSLITQENADRIAAVQAEAAMRANADNALGARLIGDNVLINGDFDFWQRGTVFTQDNVYAADRWYTQQGSITGDIRQHIPLPGETNFPDSVYTLNVNITANASSTSSYQVFEQRVEDCRTFAGKVSTVSFRVFNAGAAGRKIAVEFSQLFGVAGSTAVRGISPQVFTLAAGMNFITKTVTMPAVTGKAVGAGHSAVLTIWSSGGTTFDSRNGGLGVQTGALYFSQIKWEAGAVATPFQRRNLAVELTLCQRYYEKSYNSDVYPGTGSQPGRVNTFYDRTQGQVCTSNIPFRVTKRGVPAISVYDDLDGTFNRVRCNSGGQGTVNSIPNIGHNNAQLNYTPASGQWGCSFHFTADAEI